MCVLSDEEIRLKIAQGDLVPGGRLSRATECSYAFVPGRAFLAGSKSPPVDFPGDNGQSRIVVEPGQMVWIRTRDRVVIPNSIVGFWWQTNSLSRKGLMLVNMSMVEPGYEGDLACLFVNFGKGNVLIQAETIIAKMVFIKIEGTVGQPFTGNLPTDEYDTRLNELALEQPASFLQVGELAVDLGAAKEAALVDIRTARSEVKTTIEADLKSARDAAILEFKNDIPGALRKAFAWAFGLFVVLTAASLATSWVKGALFPNVKEVARAEAEDALRQRVVITGAPNPAEAAAMARRIDELNRRIATLESEGR